MRANLVAALLATGALVLAGCSDGQVQRTETAGQTRYVEGSGVVTIVPPDERQPAPQFSGPLLGDTGEFDLAQANGDVVVLNVWASWCPPCRKEAPALQAVAADLADDGVRFVGVNVRDNETDAGAFEHEFGVTYPSVVDPTGTLLLAFRDTLPPSAIPSTLVIDRQGRLAARVLDEVTETSLRDLVGDIAAEETAAADG
ncbi:MAG TPA: TlpA disulfide reductase family protein [Jiangellaceae bacterium]|jgi:thiol-disulfide isomerase/thioredoxin|nr:TlpA disulfide reductase family protein [Jiangellaceae bacterium]